MSGGEGAGVGIRGVGEEFHVALLSVMFFDVESAREPEKTLKG